MKNKSGLRRLIDEKFECEFPVDGDGFDAGIIAVLTRAQEIIVEEKAIKYLRGIK